MHSGDGAAVPSRSFNEAARTVGSRFAASAGPAWIGWMTEGNDSYMTGKDQTLILRYHGWGVATMMAQDPTEASQRLAHSGASWWRGTVQQQSPEELMAAPWPKAVGTASLDIGPNRYPATRYVSGNVEVLVTGPIDERLVAVVGMPNGHLEWQSIQP